MAQANLAHGPNLGPGPQFKKPCSSIYDVCFLKNIIKSEEKNVGLFFITF